MYDFIGELRYRLSTKMNKGEFIIKNFKHPISNKLYIIKYEDGFMKIKRKTKNEIEKIMTVDSFLYLWLRDENYEDI